MRRMRVVLALAVLASAPALVAAAGGPVEDAVAATDLTPDEFLAAFDDAELPGLAPIGPAPSITGDPTVDARIRAIGEQRGYRRRPLPDRELVTVDGVRVQPEAAAGWESLRTAAANAGHTIWATSGFRGHATQASIFRRKLSGTSDAAIDRRLQRVAAPGYSKHHTGYAMDIRSSTGARYAFRGTAAYAWLSADNFANAKAHGWIPSYPDGSGPAGPIPEPWEFVWVGATNLICAEFVASPDRPFCDTLGSTFEEDIEWLHAQRATTGCREHRYCTTTAITRGQAATMLWRLDGRQESGTDLPFTDVEERRYFHAAIRWLHEAGATTGTTATTFEPDRPLSRAELVTFLWRLAGSPRPEADPPFIDVDPESFASPAVAWAAENGVTRGTSATEFTPARAATRGEAAAFLRRFHSPADNTWVPGIDEG